MGLKKFFIGLLVFSFLGCHHMFGDYSHLPKEECFQECQYDANLCISTWNIDQGICRTYYRRCTFNCVNPPESFEEEPKSEGKRVRVIEENGQLYIIED